MTEILNEEGDSSVKRRLDTIQKGYEKWARITFFILVGIVVTNLVGIAFGSYFYEQNKNRIRDINENRVEIMLKSCEAQNQRHDATVKSLDALISKRLKTITDPAEISRIMAGRESTVLLIDALDPVQDCEKLVQARIHNGGDGQVKRGANRAAMGISFS